MKALSTHIVLLFASLCWGQESQPIATPTYWTAAAMAGIGTALDAYTTVTRIHPATHPYEFACTEEVWAPELYGKHPHAVRVSLVMGAEFAGSILVSRELKKRLKGKILGRAWLLPLAYEANSHWQGAIHNFQHCP
jgi:hypothetical protein